MAKPPFWLKLDGPFEDPMGEWYWMARVLWWGWPFLLFDELRRRICESR